MAHSIDDNAVLPSAAPTDVDLERWRALSVTEQKKRLEEALRAGFESEVSTRTIDDIIASARSRLQNG